MFLKRFPRIIPVCLNQILQQFSIEIILYFIRRNFPLVFIFCEKIVFPLYPFIQNIAAHYVHENLGI